MHGMILAGVGLYLAVILAVGYFSAKKVHNFTDFLIAGRQLPFSLATATLFATWFGAGTCMGAAGVAYADGFLGTIADPFAAGVSLIIAGFFYVGLLRRLKLLTVTDIFGRYYDTGSEIFASVLMIPTYVGWLGSQMVAVGYILHALTGMNAQLGIVIAAAVVVIYTTEGGMWAVVLTDVIQAVVLVVGLFWLFGAVMDQIGGFNQLIASTPPELLKLVPEKPDFDGWIVYAGQWMMCGLGCVVGQDLIQRSLASKNEQVAKQSALTAGFLYLTIGLIPLYLGLAGRLVLPELADPEHVIPQLALKYLSPLAMTLFLGALISMIMSSADSSLLAGTSLVTNNILFRIWPGLGKAQALPIARVVTVLLALLSMGIALYVKEIYGLMVNSWATLFVGVLVPVTAALYWKRANRAAAWMSMLGGTGMWLGYIFFAGGSLEDVSDPVFYKAAVYGGAASLIGYVITTFFFSKKTSVPVYLSAQDQN